MKNPPQVSQIKLQLDAKNYSYTKAAGELGMSRTTLAGIARGGPMTIQMAVRLEEEGAETGLIKFNAKQAIIEQAEQKYDQFIDDREEREAGTTISTE